MPAFEPSYIKEPFVIIKGRGSILVDSEGKEYIDFWAGNSSTIYGHCHPKIVDALKKQADTFTHYTYELYTVPMLELAEKLAKINPYGFKKSFILCTGSEAVETAIRLSRKFTRKSWIIGLYGAFHGRTYGSLSITSYARRYGKLHADPFLPCTSHIPSYYCYRCFLGLEYPDCGIRCAHLLEDAIKYSTSGEIAAFIAEPAQGGGGNLFPPDEYFPEIRKILDDYDALLIADEIITGLGRTGKNFAMEHWNVTPDIITLAKTLGGGFPVSAITAKDEIANSFKPGDHLTTFAGNPVNCAAASASLDVLIEEKLAERSHTLGKYFIDRLKDLAQEHPTMGDIQGKGLQIGVELVKDKNTKEPASEEAMKLRYKAAKRGLILPSGKGLLGNRIRINPPLVILKEQIDKGLDIVDECLKEIEREL